MTIALGQNQGLPPVRVAHLTTVDLSLRFLVMPQLMSVVELGGEAYGISAGGPYVAELESAGIRHIELRASTRGVDFLADLRSIFQLWRVIRELRPHVLHTHNPKPGVYGRITGRLAGVPIVVNTVHGLYATEDDRLIKRALVYGLEAIASRFSDQELVQSSEDHRLMNRLRMSPRERTWLLGNGIDLSRFDPAAVDPGARARIRAELGVRPDQILVGAVGRLVSEKGYRELFAAIATLDDQFVLAVAGPGDPDKGDHLGADEVAAAEAAGVRFLGMRADIEEVCSAFDVFVLASHREGFPRAAMEGAAMALPIIATDIRGCREVVEDGVNGILVPVNDPAALASAILEIGASDDLRATMGRASRQKALVEFDERQVVQTVLGAYRAVAARKGFDDLRLAFPAPNRDAPVAFRRARLEDATHLAAIHISAIERGFLPRLGPRFMTVLYQAMIRHENSVVEVAVGGGRPVAMAAAVKDTGAFYRDFLKRKGWMAALLVLPRLARPGNLRRAWETARYGSDSSSVPAEVLAIAVDRDFRGRHFGSQLLERVMEGLGRLGVREVTTVVGLPNDPSLRTFQKAGFAPVSTIEVHAGEPSQVLVWRG